MPEAAPATAARAGPAAPVDEAVGVPAIAGRADWAAPKGEAERVPATANRAVPEANWGLDHGELS
ncbi:hypothetical protein LV79_004850 [Actinokineospora globicatena]|nr:hypothetical protein [Actinokineospora globicatena]GLW80605.1 hypothetical protein Aglo01_50860 [Actinokineospora globicatena]GLW87433.1 hypothetical protein Aglo02_50720 [Actinokineospora globicatena]